MFCFNLIFSYTNHSHHLVHCERGKNPFLGHTCIVYMTECLQFIDLAVRSTVKSEKLPESRGSCYTMRTICRSWRIQVSRNVTLCFLGAFRRFEALWCLRV